MKDFRRLFKSQLYSLTREAKLLLIVLILLTAYDLVGSLISVGESVFADENLFGLKVNASMIFGTNAGSISDITVLFVFISVGLFASRDMNDKTMNYEIMSGHDRKHVFLSRAAVSILLGAGGGLIMFFMEPLVTSIMYGWGNSIPLSTAALRIALIVLLFVRISAELVLAAALLKRTYLVYIVGMTAFIMEAICFGDSKGSPYVLVFSAGEAIMKFNTFSLDHIDGTSELFFDNPMPASTAAAIAVSYLIVAAGCIYFGCRLFCRSDLD